MNTMHTIPAIILAAGFSERMGCFKPLVELNGQRVVDRVVSLYRSEGVSDICVVVGHRATEMKAALTGSGVRIVFNKNYNAGMFSSVCEGIRHLPTECRAFFVHPVDIPLVRKPTVAALLKAFQEAAGKIVYPLFDGRRGHPPLISADLTPNILTWSEAGGLRTLLEAHEKPATDVPVMDEAILSDMDTPQDRDFMLARLKHENIPTPAECRWLMQGICGLPDRVIDHCREVARTATILAEAMDRSGCDMNVAMVHAAALVHDAGRGKASHAAVGARLLQDWGFPEVADIVLAHMDITVDETLPVTEAEIVYLADKLISDDRRVGRLAERFRKKMRLHEKDPKALAAIQHRLDNAQRIQAKIEHMTGCSLKKVLDFGY
jgi:putative nucleotidyltransferase with HDIG domain